MKSCNLLFPWVFRQHIDPRLADSRPQGGQCFRGMMAHIADRRTENQAQYTDTGWNPRCAKQFLSPESTFSTATLSRCPYSALYNPTCTSISICEHVNVRQHGSHTVVKVTPICPRGVMNLSVSFNCISFFSFSSPDETFVFILPASLARCSDSDECCGELRLCPQPHRAVFLWLTPSSNVASRPQRP